MPLHGKICNNGSKNSIDTTLLHYIHVPVYIYIYIANRTVFNSIATITTKLHPKTIYCRCAIIDLVFVKPSTAAVRLDSC